MFSEMNMVMEMLQYWINVRSNSKYCESGMSNSVKIRC